MSKQQRKPAAKAPPAEIEPGVARMSFEEAVSELEEIIARMERGETGLESSLREYARGDQLIRRARQILEAAQQQIQAIAGGDLDMGKTPEGVNDAR